MSSGGGGGGDQTVTQTNMPQEALPFYMGMMERAVAESNKPYQQYTGQRVAGETGMQQQANAMAAGQQLPGQYGTATQMATAAGSGPSAQQQAGYGMMGAAAGQATGAGNPGSYGTAGQGLMADAAQAAGGYGTPGAFGATGQGVMAQAIGDSTTGRFTDAGNAQSYMNPYMQAVVDQQKQAANADFAKGSQTRAAQTAMQGGVGGIGGYRDQILQSESNKAHMSQLDSIQSAGLNAAYNQAMQQYSADEQRKLAAANQRGSLGQQLASSDLANRNLGLQGTQLQGQMGQQLSAADLANRNLGLDATKFQGSIGQQLSEGARADQAQQLNASNALMGLGEKTLEGQNSIMSNLNKYGTQQQQSNQAALDTAYNDFLAQRGATREDLTFLNSILRGQNLGSEQIRQGASPSTASQVAGAGLAGLALYNQMGTK